ncbi:MAG: uroporphyrinogen decarboxylase family protein [Bacteroidota bacterium]
MNGFERIKAALAGNPTDKTPIMLHNFMMAAHEYGATMEQFRNDPKVIAGAFIKSIDTYQHDGILVDIDTVTLAGALGVKVDFPINDPARVHDGLLLEIEDIYQLKPINIENYKYVQVWLEAVRLLKEYFKDEIYIRGNCDQAPFSVATMLRGTQNFMLDLMMAEEHLIFELLNYCNGASVQFIKLMSQTGADMVSNGDSPAGPSMISPDMYEKFAMPFEKIMADTAHSLGLPYTLHICGNTDVILELMLQTGADAFELDYQTDATKVFDIYHDKATLIGNIDPSGVLALGKPDDVKIKTQQLLETYSGTNRFILNAGCALPPTTPSANIKAMIEVARAFK